MEGREMEPANSMINVQCQENDLWGLKKKKKKVLFTFN